MSDLTKLLDAAAGIAAHDYGAAIAPALAAAITKSATNPGASPVFGLTLLQQVEAGLLILGSDELSELVTWTVGEAQKYGAKVAQGVMPKGTAA